MHTRSLGRKPAAVGLGVATVLMISLLPTVLGLTASADGGWASFRFGESRREMHVATTCIKSSSYGDFNGDTISDLAIAAPGETVKRNGFEHDSAGAVSVFYGPLAISFGPWVLPTSFRSQFWTQDAAGIMDQAEDGDQFGFSLTSGDYNRDGCWDLAIGAPFEDIAAGRKNFEDAGSVQVLYGSPKGLVSEGNQLWHQGVEGFWEGTGEGLDSGDNFGWALASGDFSGDGFVDLAVGVPGEDLSTRDSSGATNVAQDAGAVNIILGSPLGLSTGWDPPGWRGPYPFSVDQSRNWCLATSYTSWVVECLGDGVEAGDKFGFSLAVRPLELSSYTENTLAEPVQLAIGAPGEDVAIPGSKEEVRDAGMVGVVCGATYTGIWAGCTRTINQEGGADAAEPGDQFGYSLAWGSKDLAIGVPFEDLELGMGKQTIVDAGAVQYGGGLVHQYSEESFGTYVNVGGYAEPGDLFGYSLAAGDFDGAWGDDLAIGVPMKDRAPDRYGDPVIRDVGTVAVVYADSRGFYTGEHRRYLKQGNSPYRLGELGDRSEEGDRFGSSLFAANLGAGFHDDLAIGVPGEDVPRCVFGCVMMRDAGLVHIVFGGPSSLCSLLGGDCSLLNGNLLLTQGMDGVDEGDRFGATLD